MMKPAKKKNKSNIAEYLLYMWQIEDMIRSCNCDMAELEEKIILSYPEEERKETRAWYKNLVEQMNKEEIREKGHLSDLREIVGELEFLHRSLITIYQDSRYIQFANAAAPNITELQKRSNNTSLTPVETCLNGLYGLLLLKLQKKEVSADTMKAMETFSKMLGYLSLKYNELKSGNLTQDVLRNN